MQHAQECSEESWPLQPELPIRSIKRVAAAAGGRSAALPPSIDPLKAKPFSPTAAATVGRCLYTHNFRPEALPPPFTLRSLDSGVGSSEEEGEGSKVPGLESHGD